MTRFIHLLISAAIFFLYGCDKPFFKNSSPSLKKLTIAYTYQPQCTLIHVAQEKGFFREEGLEVTPMMHEFGKTALQSVLEHKADMATVAETPLLFSIMNGDKVFIIATIVASSKNNAIVARKDSGIKSAQDLKGKRIGVTPLTTSDFFLDSILIASGLTRNDIFPVFLKPNEMEENIFNKTVDAVSTWNYPLTQIKNRLGDNVVLFFDEDIYTETFNLATMQDFTKKNPETVRQVLRAVIKAQDFVKQHPVEAQKIMAKSTNMPFELVKEVWDAFSFDVTLDQTILLTLEDEARWAIKNKLLERKVVPDFGKYMYVDALRAVKTDVKNKK